MLHLLVWQKKTKVIYDIIYTQIYRLSFYFYNISAVLSSGLLQMPVDPDNLQVISDWTFLANLWG